MIIIKYGHLIALDVQQRRMGFRMFGPKLFLTVEGLDTADQKSDKNSYMCRGWIIDYRIIPKKKHFWGVGGGSWGLGASLGDPVDYIEKLES